MLTLSMSRKKQSSAVTLADVAREADVSMITASRALRDVSVVADETRRRVRAAAARLDYTPNLLARWLSERRSRTIGVVIHELDYAYFSPIVGALQARARSEGYLVITAESHRTVELEQEIIERFRQLMVSAILVHPSSSAAEHLAAARQEGTPVIAFARPWEFGDSVAVDNPEAGRMAARFLLKRRRRRVAVVGTSDPENIPAQKRLAGLREVMGEVGFPPPPPEWQVLMAGTTFENGGDAADHLVRHPLPDAVFCATDRLAFGLINRLLEIGVRVPEDVAVVGCDNIPHGAYSQVPLTTVAMPVGRMAELVTRTVFERIEGSGQPRPVQELLAPELIVRRSCP